MPKTDDDPNANPWLSIDFHIGFCQRIQQDSYSVRGRWATFNFSTHKC